MNDHWHKRLRSYATDAYASSTFTRMFYMHNLNERYSSKFLFATIQYNSFTVMNYELSQIPVCNIIKFKDSTQQVSTDAQGALKKTWHIAYST